MGRVVMGGAAVHSPCLPPRVHCGVRFLTSGLSRALSLKNMMLKERAHCRGSLEGSLEVEKGHFYNQFIDYHPSSWGRPTLNIASTDWEKGAFLSWNGPLCPACPRLRSRKPCLLLRAAP